MYPPSGSNRSSSTKSAWSISIPSQPLICWKLQAHSTALNWKDFADTDTAQAAWIPEERPVHLVCSLCLACTFHCTAPRVIPSNPIISKKLGGPVLEGACMRYTPPWEHRSQGVEYLLFCILLPCNRTRKQNGREPCDSARRTWLRVKCTGGKRVGYQELQYLFLWGWGKEARRIFCTTNKVWQQCIQPTKSCHIATVWQKSNCNIKRHNTSFTLDHWNIHQSVMQKSKSLPTSLCI